MASANDDTWQLTRQKTRQRTACSGQHAADTAAGNTQQETCKDTADGSGEHTVATVQCRCSRTPHWPLRPYAFPRARDRDEIRLFHVYSCTMRRGEAAAAHATSLPSETVRALANGAGALTRYIRSTDNSSAQHSCEHA